MLATTPVTLAPRQEHPMTKALESTAGPVRAYQHVGGQSTRFKAKPTKLTRLAARVMCASGCFTTRRRPAWSRSGHFFGALAVLLAAGTLAIAGGPSSYDRDASIALAQLALPDQMFSLGVGEYLGTVASLAPAAEPLAAQD